jgi:hypothetical protein
VDVIETEAADTVAATVTPIMRYNESHSEDGGCLLLPGGNVGLLAIDAPEAEATGEVVNLPAIAATGTTPAVAAVTTTVSQQGITSLGPGGSIYNNSEDCISTNLVVYAGQTSVAQPHITSGTYWGDEMAYTTLDRFWGTYAVKGWEIIQGGLSKQKICDSCYERYCLGLFCNTKQFQRKLMEQNNYCMPQLYAFTIPASAVANPLLPIRISTCKPRNKVHSNFTKISNTMLSSNPNRNFLFHCKRNIPFWGGWRSEQAVPIQSCNSNRLFEMEIRMNGPSHYVRNWRFAKNYINFKIVEPKLRVAYMSIQQSLFENLFHPQKEISYQMPDFQRETFVTPFATQLCAGSGAYTFPLKHINGATRTLLVIIRDYNRLHGIDNTGNVGAMYRDHDAYFDSGFGTEVIKEMYFSYNSTPLFLTNSSSVQLTCHEQLFSIRNNYFKENDEDTQPTFNREYDISSQANQVALQKAFNSPTGLYLPHGTGHPLCTTISNQPTTTTKEPFPWFLWTFGTNGDINKPGWGIRDLSTYPADTVKLNINLGIDYVPTTTPYQIDVYAFTENFITKTTGEYFLLKMLQA